LSCSMRRLRDALSSNDGEDAQASAQQWCGPSRNFSETLQHGLLHATGKSSWVPMVSAEHAVAQVRKALGMASLRWGGFCCLGYCALASNTTPSRFLAVASISA
jgi:hypothetical protein